MQKITEKAQTAIEWIKTDKVACHEDLLRLGLDGAVNYQLGLVRGCGAAGDNRWVSITRDAMRDAFLQMFSGTCGVEQ